MITRIRALPEVVSLGCCSATVISKGTPTKPDLFRLDFDDGRDPIVFKTYALKNRFVQVTAGWFVTRREYKILQYLKGIKGIGKACRQPSRVGLFLEWIPGKPLNRYRRDGLSQQVFTRLVDIVEQMHRAGVVHLDIAHRGNILVTPEEEPVLIDFQAALYVKNWPEWLAKWLRKVDDLTLLKWKKKRFSQLLTPDDQAACQRREHLSFLWPWSHPRSKSKPKPPIK